MAPHIVIVDADRSAAHVTGALIERIAPDATLTYATTPYQGWLAAQCTAPHVMIIDPGPSVPASTLLLQLCKDVWPLMQVVALTPARTNTTRCPADVHIDKSVAAPTLVNTLRGVIQHATGVLHPAH